MNRHLLWAIAALSAACVDPRTVAQTLNETEQVIEQAQAVLELGAERPEAA